jgi:hypothetical protein
MPKKSKKKDLQQTKLLVEIAALKPKLKSFEEILVKAKLLNGDFILEEIILIDDMNSLS